MAPAEAGQAVEFYSKRSKVPWYAPAGVYTYTYRAVDKRKQLLFCFRVTLEHRCVDDDLVCAGLPLVSYHATLLAATTNPPPTPSAGPDRSCVGGEGAAWGACCVPGLDSIAS